MKQTFGILVVNRPTVLNHIAGLISRRGYNIISIAAGACEDPRLTRITLVVDCEEENVDQIRKQLVKLVDTVYVADLTKTKSIERELALIKVKAEAKDRSAIVDIANIFGAKIVSAHTATMVIETSGSPETIDALIVLMEERGILEITRTGVIVMAREEELTKC
ncbi:acetolactate synthase small subunit [Clostridia bacterium]|nr:acetolactate synthase small subunit [Clostridia bacterium]